MEQNIVLPQELKDFMVQNRRYFHAHPELSFQEEGTSAYIKQRLDAYGIPYVQIAGYHSVIGRLRGSRPGKTVAIRADIDALPMQEQNEAPYRSTNPGVMHACGHDAHTAVLLGLAKLFSEHREQLRGEIVFLFQHGEEKLPGGAVTLVQHGVLDGVDAVLGAHMFSSVEVGTVCYNAEALTASADTFDILLKGRGGHGAQPHLCDDALLAGAMLAQQLQSVVSRNVDPLLSAVVSVCELHAGTNFNIIPDSCRLSGTVRSLDEGTRAMVEARIRDITAALAIAQNLQYEIQYEKGYPVMNCDPCQVKRAIDAVHRLTGHRAQWMRPSMGGEDFAYYTQKVPGVFFFVGCGNREAGIVHAHHSPRFDLDERAIGVMAEVLLASYCAVATDD